MYGDGMAVAAISRVLDETRTCQRARHGNKRREVWIWTAVKPSCGCTSGCRKRSCTTALTTGCGNWLPAERRIV